MLKKKKIIKFLFLSMGPGETGQAIALAEYLKKKIESQILFCSRLKEMFFFLKKEKEAKIFFTPQPQSLKKVILKEKPEFLFIFNSKIWGKNFSEKPNFKKESFVFCFDSNWLFNSQKYPFFDYLKWADKYFILFPQKIFQLGLKEFGGNFEIERKIKEKIFSLGFIPSYSPLSEREKMKIREKLKIKKNEKFIFSYFSSPAAGHRIWALENFIKAGEFLVKRKKQIKALYVGPTHNLNLKKIKKSWLLIKEKLSAQEFFQTLASSDLVFMHQGMATLAQAICSQIPVICNVSVLKLKPSKLHFWEVLPFKKAGVCEMFSKTTKIKKIAKAIYQLLFKDRERKKMIERQKEIFERGEEKFFKELKKLL